MRSFIFLTFLATSLAFTPRFQDVTVKAGIDITPGGPGTRRLLKYGGPTVVDLDRDGFYGLIFVHHGSYNPELYFNNRDGTFTSVLFSPRRDVHAITPFLLPTVYTAFFTLIPGGNAGKRPTPPVVYRLFRNRSVTVADTGMGLDRFTGRGRTVVFMPFRKGGSFPDALYMNADASEERCPGCTDGQYDAYVYTGRNPNYKPSFLKGFKPTEHNSNGLAIDPDGDGRLELVSWRNLTIHKVVGNSKLKDMTRKFLDNVAYTQGVAAVAEIDFDNDGDFDLYIARDKNYLRTEPGDAHPDLLLENRNGKFVDVSIKAGIPRNSISRGVTVGDFNNDGWMDLYVTAMRGNDILLLNNGDGTFKSVDIGIGKQGALGDNAMAVDYDNDGRVDLIRSEGAVGKDNIRFGGQFRILRNVRRKIDSIGRWIKVSVGWLGKQTGQHAVVTVVANGKRMMQRVGPAGVQTMHSYLDTVHFGIGKAKGGFVKVVWLNGEVRTRRVNAGDIAKFGRRYSGRKF